MAKETRKKQLILLQEVYEANTSNTPAFDMNICEYIYIDHVNFINKHFIVCPKTLLPSLFLEF